MARLSGKSCCAPAQFRGCSTGVVGAVEGQHRHLRYRQLLLARCGGRLRDQRADELHQLGRFQGRLVIKAVALIGKRCGLEGLPGKRVGVEGSQEAATLAAAAATAATSSSMIWETPGANAVSAWRGRSAPLPGRGCCGLGRPARAGGTARPAPGPRRYRRSSAPRRSRPPVPAPGPPGAPGVDDRMPGRPPDRRRNVSRVADGNQQQHLGDQHCSPPIGGPATLTARARPDAGVAARTPGAAGWRSAGRRRPGRRTRRPAGRSRSTAARVAWRPR